MSIKEQNFLEISPKGKIKSSNTVSIEQAFPIEFIDSDILISKNGRVCIGYKLNNLPVAESLSKDGYSDLCLQWKNALHILEENTIVHRCDIYPKTKFKINTIPKKDGFLSKKLRGMITNRDIVSHKAYLFLVFPNIQEKKPMPVNTFFTKLKSNFKNPLEDIEQRIIQANTKASQFVTYIDGFNSISVSRLTTKELESLMNSYLNLDFNDENDKFSSVISKDAKGMYIGNKAVGMVSFREQGTEVDYIKKNEKGVGCGLTYSLAGDLHFERIVNYYIKIADTEKELSKLDTQRSILSSFTSKRDQEKQIHALELERLGEMVRSENSHLVYTYLNVITYDSDVENLNKKINLIKKAMASMYGSVGMIENIDVANLFFCCIPGASHEIYRWLLMPEENACLYINNTTDIRSAKGHIFLDRNGYPAYLDTWDDNLDNKNMIIVGPSGSGKSVQVNQIIMQDFYDGTDVVMIDVGGSYKGLYRILEKEFPTQVAYYDHTELDLNPFLIRRDSENLWVMDQDKITYLVNVLSLIWRQGSNLSTNEISYLKTFLYEYYEIMNEAIKKNPETLLYPCMDSFYEYLKTKSITRFEDKDYFDPKSLALSLKDYTSQAQYGKYFNSNRNMDISEKYFIVFDMFGIKSDKSINGLISLMITQLVVDKMEKHRTRLKRIYLDEAWSLMSGLMSSFIEELYRTIRKYNGSVGIITQGITEIKQSSIGEAILQNTAIRILLNHSGVGQKIMKQVQEILEVDDHKMELLSSLRKGDKELWREFLVLFGKDPYVYMSQLTPEAAVTFDTRAVQRKQLDDEISRTGNVFVATENLAIKTNKL